MARPFKGKSLWDWSDVDISFLIDNHNHKTIQEISEHLKKPRGAVLWNAKKLGIQFPNMKARVKMKKKIFVYYLYAFNGNIRKACTHINTAPSQLYAWKKDDAAFAIVLDSCKNIIKGLKSKKLWNYKSSKH